MQTKVFHSVNCGLYLLYDHAGLFIDGLHSGYKQGFSEMPGELWRQFDRSAHYGDRLQGALFTHHHPDHFCQKSLDTLLIRSPHIAIHSPQITRSVDHIVPCNSMIRMLRIGPFRIYAINTQHDGQQYRDVFHQSFVVNTDFESFFIAGDACLSRKLLNAHADVLPKKTDIVFINLYQACSAAAHDYIRALNPNRICLYHLPFSKDDRYGFWKMAVQAIRRFPKDLPLLELVHHMRWLCEAGDF